MIEERYFNVKQEVHHLGGQSCMSIENKVFR